MRNTIENLNCIALNLITRIKHIIYGFNNSGLYQFSHKMKIVCNGFPNSTVSQRRLSSISFAAVNIFLIT